MRTAFLFSLAAAALFGGSPGPSGAQETHVLVVVGLGGDPEYRATFHQWASDFTASAVDRLGIDADTASGGREALRRLADGGYDVVLMDEQMPDMDGLEATRELRRGAGDAARIPVVALTANADEAARQRCMDAGMDAFLPKPVRRKALRTVLARWIPELAAGGDGISTDA